MTTDDSTIARRGLKPYFPKAAFGYFLMSVVTIIVVLFLADRLLIPALEARSVVSAAAWKAEDLRIMRQNFRKIDAGRDRPWSTPGFRVEESRRRAHRILVLGDSFTWGDGYTNINDIWWRQLERELHNKGYRDVEVIAAGLSGMSTRDELEVAKKLVPKLRPDLVLFGYVANDAEEGAVPYLESPSRDSFEAVVKRLGTLLPNIESMLHDRHRRKALVRESGPGPGYPYPERELLLLGGENFRRYRGTLAEIRAYFSFAAIPVASVTLPQFPSREYFEPRFAPVREAYREAGIPFLDLLGPFVHKYGDVQSAADAARWGINPANVHPGPRAAHFYAEQIAAFLEVHHKPILGSRSTDLPRPVVKINDWMPPELAPNVNLRNTVSFNYPSEADLLRMPSGTPYIQLSFETPVELREIRLLGRDLERATAQVTLVDRRIGFDDLTVHALDEKAGSALAWPLGHLREPLLINTIRLTAEFRTRDRFSDRHVRLVIVPPNDETLSAMDFQEAAPRGGLPTPDVDAARHEPEWHVSAVADLDGDAVPDILWSNTRTHQVTAWIMSRTEVRSEVAFPSPATTDWFVAAAGDLDGDGQVDLVYRNRRTGENALWRMNGPRFVSAERVPSLRPVSWRLAGAADFDRDHRSDLVWRHSESGQNEVWLMNGAVVKERRSLQTIPAVASRIDAVGDANGDGHPDLLWRNYQSGDVVVWLMAGTELQSAVPVTTIQAANSEIRGLADFNGDHRPDLLWRNIATGENVIWFMRDNKLLSTYALPRRAEAPATTRDHQAIAVDIDGDRDLDLISRAPFSVKTVASIHENGPGTIRALPDAPSLGSRLVEARDFDGNGRADILWHDPDSGVFVMWMFRPGTDSPWQWTFDSRDDLRWALRGSPDA